VVIVDVNLLLGGDRDAELVRHFLIETTSKGVRLKGCNSEPTFGELSAVCFTAVTGERRSCPK